MVTKRSSMIEIDSAYVQQRELELKSQSRKRLGLIRRLSVVGIIGLCLGCLAFVTLYTQANTIEEKMNNRLALEQKLEDLVSEQSRLEQEIKNYNDLDYIAEVARRDYYLSKPGETLFKLPE